MRLLDLFCGAGGCAAGYVRAGFEVHGVDHRPQPRYLASGATSFVQADALEYLAEHGHEYDAIHASPPCQAYSRCRNMPWVGEHPDMVPATLAALRQAGRPWIVENVPGAPLEGLWAVTICGTQLGLRVRRHRLFASSILLLGPGGPCNHRPGDVTVAGNRMGIMGTRTVSYACADGSTRHRPAAAPRSLVCEVMGIDWMVRRELSQAIPPAYTHFLGRQLLNHLQGGPG